MNCYVCDRLDSTQSVAIAICPNCKVGLCTEHLDEERRSVGPGGMRYGCTHDTPIPKERTSR
ncbi:MAG TPA: DUF2180 family protein [Thermoleophilaceae bacterium]